MKIYIGVLEGGGERLLGVQSPRKISPFDFRQAQIERRVEGFTLNGKLNQSFSSLK